MYISYIGFHSSSRVERSTSVYATSSFLDHQNKALPNTNQHPFTIAPAHTHPPVNVTAALNPITTDGTALTIVADKSHATLDGPARLFASQNHPKKQLMEPHLQLLQTSPIDFSIAHHCTPSSCPRSKVLICLPTLAACALIFFTILARPSGDCFDQTHPY